MDRPRSSGKCLATYGEEAGATVAQFWSLRQKDCHSVRLLGEWPSPSKCSALLRLAGSTTQSFCRAARISCSCLLPSRDAAEAAVYLASLRDGKAVNPVPLLKNQTAARYTPAGGGRILFVRNDNLYSQKLNRQTRKLEGGAELTAQGVASQPAMAVHRGDFSVARNGTVAWRPGKAAACQVTEFDRSGNQIATSGPPGSYSDNCRRRRTNISSWSSLPNLPGSWRWGNLAGSNCRTVCIGSAGSRMARE